MAHNVCCDSYQIYNVTYICYTIVPVLGGQVCDVLACCFQGPLFTDKDVIRFCCELCTVTVRL